LRLLFGALGLLGLTFLRLLLRTLCLLRLTLLGLLLRALRLLGLTLLGLLLRALSLLRLTLLGLLLRALSLLGLTLLRLLLRALSLLGRMATTALRLLWCMRGLGRLPLPVASGGLPAIRLSAHVVAGNTVARRCHGDGNDSSGSATRC
jgi:hypothetical protein